ncbi:MAG: hypothetical protein PXZ08_06845 [Actinomycetota bacterium]|nr:hypothetical protein [Actinomycetota bacterium]
MNPESRRIRLLTASLLIISFVASFFVIPYTGLSANASSHLSRAPTKFLNPGNYSENFVLQGRPRFFILHVPPGKATKKRPLILVLPGATNTAQMTMNDTTFVYDANTSGDVVAFLQGYGLIFNEGAGANPSRRAGINDVAYVSDVLNKLRSLVNYNPKRVALAGYSNGAMTTGLVGCRLSSKFSLIVPVEGEIPAPVSATCHPTHPFSVLEVHATADPTIPYNGGTFAGTGAPVTVLSAPQAGQRWSHLEGCTAGPITIDTTGIVTTRYSSCHGNVTVTLRTIIGGAHVWPWDIGLLVVNALGH